LNYIFDILIKAGADVDALKLAYATAMPFMLSALLGWLFVPRVLLISRKKKLYDIPDARKVHKQPIPRLGGITFFPVLLMSFCLSIGIWMLMHLYGGFTQVHILIARFILLAVGMMILYLTGVADDLIGVSYKAKFVVQILCALLFPLSGLWIHDLSGLFWLHEIPAWIGIPLTVFSVVYITNAINLIDGVDGLAAGLCSISLFTLGMAAAIKAQYLFCMISFSMVGVLLPFWFYNVFGNAEKGRKIFMGDTGSLLLGYLLSFLLVYMASLDKMGFPRGMLLMGFSTMIIPLMDIPRVMMARIREGRNPFTPDKNHIHHKLMRAGLKPIWTMAILLAVSAFLIGFTVLSVMLDLNKTLILLIDVFLGVVLHLIIDYFIKKKETEK
jgi:UDP-N-acetylmuramyl pentapeptide phosphotransferase/UDP-N-acetylglucosamine-1-phosphate transferase